MPYYGIGPPTCCSWTHPIRRCEKQSRFIHFFTPVNELSMQLQKRTAHQVIAEYDKELTIIFGAESPDITELMRVYAETAPNLPRKHRSAANACEMIRSLHHK
jgi:hypothetical protein